MNKKVNKHQIGDVVLELIPMPVLIFSHWEGLQKQDAPQVPQVVTRLAGGKEGFTYNRADETYVELLKEFNDRLNLRSIDFIISYCVLTEPPLDWVVPDGLGDNDHKNRKLVWVLSLLETGEEIDRFTKICMGQAIPSEEEIAQEVATFPGNSERHEHLGLPIPE